MIRRWFQLGTVCALLVQSAAADPQTNAAAPAAAITTNGPRTVRQASLFADVHARALGDILTVAIVERASASNSSTISTSRQSKFLNKGAAGTGGLDFIPAFGMAADLGSDHTGAGQLSREGRLTARMAVTVNEVRPNGDLGITGEHEVQINDEKEILQLSGIVRPIDIREGNVVFSSDIANAKIMYKGKGEMTNGTKPNVIARVLGWLF